MSVLQYLKTNLGMSGPEFMREWKGLGEADREWFKQAARDEAKVLGVEVKN
jgi:hypothetical protein